MENGSEKLGSPIAWPGSLSWIQTVRDWLKPSMLFVRAAGLAGQVYAAKAWLLKTHDRPWGGATVGDPEEAQGAFIGLQALVTATAGGGGEGLESGPIS